MHHHTFVHYTCIHASSYGLPITLRDYLKYDSLMSMEDIPYGFVCFEQGFFVLWDMEYISATIAESTSLKSRGIQSILRSLHGTLVLITLRKPTDIDNHTGSFLGLTDFGCAQLRVGTYILLYVY